MTRLVTRAGRHGPRASYTDMLKSSRATASTVSLGQNPGFCLSVYAVASLLGASVTREAVVARLSAGTR